MPTPKRRTAPARNALPKAPSGIEGLDEITGGGLPRGRPTLVCGSAGAGKTLLAMEFLVRGAMQYDEPGVFMAFEETKDELTMNVRSLGFDLEELGRRKRVVIDFVRVERDEIEETGLYDLEGLFVRLNYAIDAIGAKRVVLDTLEALFAGLSNASILRSELRRLFRWLKQKGVTAVITAERGDGVLTRHGLEEYVSDCVILLDHRVSDQVSTRRLRIVKYRGTVHGTNEYPFLIDDDGISVLPITSARLEHTASGERVSSGVARLDVMLGGKGYYRGSSVLVTGTAGSGKTSLSASFASAACERGERCLYFAFEESQGQLVRNMRSIGIDLDKWAKKGLLRFHTIRSQQDGLEMHLARFHKLLREFAPDVVVFDPVGSFIQAGTRRDANAMVTRLIDMLKVRGTTAFMTSLASGGESLESTDIDISSLIDTWIVLRDIDLGGERNHALHILKSRGMAHSNQIREFVLTDHGIELADLYIGSSGVLTGSLRQAQESRERADALSRHQEIESLQRSLSRKREALQEKIASLQRELRIEEEETKRIIAQQLRREDDLRHDREQMARSRRADGSDGPKARKRGAKRR
jgi:circadian clock protein KaiC